MMRAALLVLFVLCGLSVTSCAISIPREEADMSLTWQEAKTETMKMELEIASLIPKEKIVSVDQRATGNLFSCSKTQHNWNGATTVTLTEGTQTEPIVRLIESHYADSAFEIQTRLNVARQYEVSLVSSTTAEIYVIAEGFSPDTIRIASGSACFTVPEGVYPGGDF